MMYVVFVSVRSVFSELRIFLTPWPTNFGCTEVDPRRVPETNALASILPISIDCFEGDRIFASNCKSVEKDMKACVWVQTMVLRGFGGGTRDLVRPGRGSQVKQLDTLHLEAAGIRIRASGTFQFQKTVNKPPPFTHTLSQLTS